MSFSVGGGGGLSKLAADLTWPSTPGNGVEYVTVTGINAMGALTTALSLTGKFALGHLSLQNMIAETTTVKLTIDGAVVFNDVGFTSFASAQLIGGLSNVTYQPFGFSVSNSLLLEVQKLTDTSIDVRYTARPIV